MPLTLTCPIGGEEWPTTSFQCVVDTKVDVVKPKNIHFWCPGKHDFTLARALKTKMFTKEQGQRILGDAQKLKGAKIK